MARYNQALYAFNRGRVSPLMLARVDVARLALSADIQTNWMPRKLGSMILRPGDAYIGNTKDNKKPVHLPFIFALDDTAIIELTDLAMRVRVDEEIISRVSVSTAITNGTFNSNLTGWMSSDESGALSDWATGGYMSLKGTGFNRAIRSQQVTVAGGDQNKEHALRITIAWGSVTLRVGVTAGAEDYVEAVKLRRGTHSIAFTPTGDFYIHLSNNTEWAALVDSVAVESSGDMVLTTPWAEDSLNLVRDEQSADVIFCACDGFQQRRIERHAERSWSVVYYEPEDGPFLVENLEQITLTPSAVSGDITLTASRALFRSTHVGALFSLTSIGQSISGVLAGEDQFTDPVRITGVGSDQRTFNINISDTWVGTLTLQRSVGDTSSWIDITSYVANTSTTYNDGLDNQIIYYRIGFKTGNYTSGSAIVALSYASGGLTGIVRIKSYTSSTSVSVSVLKHLGGTTGTTDWSEGQWSDFRGYPTTPCLDDGRLEWLGRDKFVGSITDAFESFDDTVEGNSGPINRSIGSGPVDNINWAIPLSRLAIGGELSEYFAYSSSLDEPLAPDSFNIKSPSTQGSAKINALKMNDEAIFVQRCGTRIFSVSFDNIYQKYPNTELTMLCPEIGEPGIAQIDIQFQPDIRLHALRTDGTAAVQILDKAEETKCWIEIEKDGEIEDVIVMPGQVEDTVYYTVKRTVNGSVVRHFGKWALESECTGGTTIYEGVSTATMTDLDYPEGTKVTARTATGVKIGNYTVSDNSITLGAPVTYAAITPSLYKLADAHIVYDGVATATITGLDHLEGEEVIVWADGKDFSPTNEETGIQTTYTVTSGQITIGEQVELAIAGLAYTARFKSTKLDTIAQGGTPLGQKKKIDDIGVIMASTHAKGLRYGRDFNHLQSLPRTFSGQDISADHVFGQYDQQAFAFPGEWSTDGRLCLQAQAPRPCNLLAAFMGITLNEHV